MLPIQVRWIGSADDDELLEPAFVDASISRLATTGTCHVPDSLELVEATDDERLLVLTSVDPFRPDVRYRVLLRLHWEGGAPHLEVHAIARMT